MPSSSDGHVVSYKRSPLNSGIEWELIDHSHKAFNRLVKLALSGLKRYIYDCGASTVEDS